MLIIMKGVPIRLNGLNVSQGHVQLRGRVYGVGRYLYT